jgi:hypothetical protein
VRPGHADMAGKALSCRKAKLSWGLLALRFPSKCLRLVDVVHAMDSAQPLRCKPIRKEDKGPVCGHM